MQEKSTPFLFCPTFANYLHNTLTVLLNYAKENSIRFPCSNFLFSTISYSINFNSSPFFACTEYFFYYNFFLSSFFRIKYLIIPLENHLIFLFSLIFIHLSLTESRKIVKNTFSKKIPFHPLSKTDRKCKTICHRTKCLDPSTISL